MKDRRLKIEAIVLQARQFIDVSERASYLDNVCAGDSGLRATVERTLAVGTKEGGTSLSSDETVEAPSSARGDAPTTDGRIRSSFAETPGSVVGRYTLLRKIGEGGFGVVYIARQEEPVRRKVALKIIKLGMDTRKVITRFEGERQTLAMMNHPHIAKVFDAGATETGRPYFVMELVQGMPINKYCDSQKAALRDRLSLFIKVCNAVQHAHQKGIIHRDLKPSNILVTRHDGQPVPKVIDFGIAKATEQKVTAETMVTEFGQLMGTPAYMSPEQAAKRGEDVDTRSDVYSLGVVLYELLTGTIPFAMQTLRDAHIDEIRRMIREEEPSKPSTRISTVGDELAGVAQLRGVEPKKLGTMLKGDLDWIVMKALEKDRQRRYESANGLGMDIQRYLDGEAVLAVPPSRSYRLRKFARRNKGPVTAGVAVAVALLIGVIGFAWQAQIARQERVVANAQRDRARVEAAKAQTTTEFLTSIFGGIDPYTAQGMDTSLLRMILGNVDERIKKELAGQPEVQASIRATLGRAYTSLGQYDKAHTELNTALQLQKASLGEEDRQTLRTNAAQVALLEREGKHAEAEKLAASLLAAMRHALGVNDTDTLNLMRRLGEVQQRLGKYRESETNLRYALGSLQRLHGENDSQTLSAMLCLARTLEYEWQYAEAEKLAKQVLKSRQQAQGSDTAKVYEAMATLASIINGQLRFAESEPLERDAVAGLTRILGPDNAQTLNVLNNLAFTLHRLGKNEEAEALFRETLKRRQRTLGDDHPETIFSVANLGRFFYDVGRLAEAEPLIRQGLEARRRVLGPEHRDTLYSMQQLATLLKDRREFDEATQLFGEVAAVSRKNRKPGDTGLGIALYNWAAMMQDGGNDVAAEPIFREVLATHDKFHHGDEPYIAACMNALARCLKARGEFDEADQYYRKGLAMRRRLYPKPNRDLAYSLTGYGEFLFDRGNFDAAEPLLREGIAVLQTVGPDGAWEIGSTMSLLGGTLSGLSRFAEAEPLLLEGFHRLRINHDPKPNLIPVARSRIVDLYQKWDGKEPGMGYDAKADAWQKETLDAAEP